MEFRTKLTLVVYNKDRSNHLRAIRETVLPFVPSDGMYLQVGMAYPITITKVVWLTDEKIMGFRAKIVAKLCEMPDFSQKPSKMIIFPGKNKPSVPTHQ